MRWFEELQHCPAHVFAHIAVDGYRKMRRDGTAPPIDEFLVRVRSACEHRQFAPLSRFEALLALSYELSEGNVAVVSTVIGPEVRAISARGEWQAEHNEVLSHYGLSLVAEDDANPESQAQVGRPSETIQEVSYLKQANETRRAAVVILCALDEEFDAFAPFAGDSPPKAGVPANRKYRELSGEGPIILVGMGESGNVHSALATQWAISEWDPGLVILAGIAGGIESQIPNFRLGDVIVPPQIVGYEYAKLLPRVVRRRLRVARAGATALAVADEVDKASAWLGTISVADPEDQARVPHIYFGDLLSGEKVLADIDVVSDLAGLWPPSVAVEMEAAGLALAAYQAGTGPEILVAKAASDWADVAKDDRFHPRASAVSASFCYAVARSWAEHATPSDRRAIRKTVRTDGLVKNAFWDRLDSQDARRLANVFNVNKRYTRAWPDGRLPELLWDWLEDRTLLQELPDKLLVIDRQDLALLFYETNDNVLAALADP